MNRKSSPLQSLLIASFTIAASCSFCQETTAPQAQVSNSETTQPAEAASIVAPAAQAASTSVTLANGVMYEIIKPGTGDPAPTTATLRLHYALYLTNGEKIEDSRHTELPIPLNMKKGNDDFIPGVEAGVEGMKLHEIRKLYVPADQAYGTKGKGKIPANAPLFFEMELVDIR